MSIGSFILHDSIITAVILLVDKCYRERVGGVVLRFIFEEAVAFLKADVTDSDCFCLTITIYFRLLARMTSKEEHTNNEFGNVDGEFVLLLEEIGKEHGSYCFLSFFGGV